MIVLNKAINAGNFFYCANYFGQYSSISMLNSGVAAYHQWYYVIEGSAIVETRDNSDPTTDSIHTVNASSNMFVDAAPTKDKYITIKTDDSGFVVVAFNPMLADQILDVEILDTAQTVTITAADVRKTVVCIKGTATINGKQLSAGQHAKIFPGKSAEIVLNDNAICAIVQ